MSPGESRARVCGRVPSAGQVSLSVSVGWGDKAGYATLGTQGQTVRKCRTPKRARLGYATGSRKTWGYGRILDGMTATVTVPIAARPPDLPPPASARPRLQSPPRGLIGPSRGSVTGPPRPSGLKLPVGAPTAHGSPQCQRYSSSQPSSARFGSSRPLPGRHLLWAPPTSKSWTPRAAFAGLADRRHALRTLFAPIAALWLAAHVCVSGGGSVDLLSHAGAAQISFHGYVAYLLNS